MVHGGGILSRAAILSWRAGELGQAEVEYLRLSAIGDEDIAGLDVAMDDALCVRRVKQRPRIGWRIRSSGSSSSGSFSMARSSCRPSSSSITMKCRPSCLADVINRADVRMVQRRRRAGLALKALQRLRVFLHALRQELQRDVPAETCVLRLVHDAHAARAELVRDLVMEKELAYHRGGILPAKPVFRVFRPVRVFPGPQFARYYAPCIATSIGPASPPRH